MNSIHDQQKYKSNVEFEKAAQRHMDDYYKELRYEVDRTQADWTHDVILKKEGSIDLRVEEKFQKTEWPSILVEILQCLEINPPQLGWYYHIDTNYLAYVFCSADFFPTNIYMVSWRRFNQWFLEWLSEDRARQAPVSSKGNGITLNIAVPINQIPENLYKHTKRR